MAEIKTAIIGLANYASKRIIDLEKHSGFELCYVYHPEYGKAQGLYSEQGTDNLTQILSEGEVEAIFVASPTYTHFEYVIRALEAGKHVFVEKPLAKTLQQARKIVSSRKATEKLVMVGHNLRRQPCFRRIKRLLDKEEIGEFVNVTINHSHGAVYNIAKDNWRNQKALNPEGSLAMTGVHYFDLIHYLLGRIRSIDALLFSVSKQSESPDANAVLMELDNGGSVLMQTNYCQCSEKFVHLFGTEGTIYCDNEKISLRKGRDKNRIQSKSYPVEVAKNISILEELDEFYAAIHNGQQVETGDLQGLANSILLDACRKSAEQKRRVYMDEYTDYLVSDHECPG